jgi:Uncharacterized protein conserved in bacteria (DUF2188)
LRDGQSFTCCRARDGIFEPRELEEAVMSMLHVVADVRGEWGVFEDASRRPLSVHPSATEAEFVAWGHAKDRGSERILVHDRYGRTRAAVGACASAVKR